VTERHEIKGAAGKAGYCDAIMGREPKNEFAGHFEREKYQAGYTAGKESGVVFFAAREQNRVTEGGKSRGR
jgi:hypothetical protein